MGVSFDIVGLKFSLALFGASVKMLNSYIHSFVGRLGASQLVERVLQAVIMLGLSDIHRYLLSVEQAWYDHEVL